MGDSAPADPTPALDRHCKALTGKNEEHRARRLHKIEQYRRSSTADGYPQALTAAFTWRTRDEAR